MADFKMLFLLWMLTILVGLVCNQEPPPCLTGKPEDVQFWVTETGELTDNVDEVTSIDLSGGLGLAAKIKDTLASVVRSRRVFVKFLSLARNQLTRVPAIFNDLLDDSGRDLSATVEYLSFYGNQFIEVSSPGVEYGEELNATRVTVIRTGIVHRGETRVMWSAGFNRVIFSKLKELDLRSCGIQTIDSQVFRNMPQLEALYLSGNSISMIQSNAFDNVRNLVHLDLSRNSNFDTNQNSRPLMIESNAVFSRLSKLKSLDLSHTLLNPSRVIALRSLGRQLKRLSLCYAGPFRLEPGFFARTSLSVLDLSGNNLILETNNVLSGLEDTLTVLYASDIGLTKFEVFRNFRNLEILRVNNNEMVNLDTLTARSLTSLQALDLRRNRFIQWSESMFSHLPALNLLDLRSNTLNIINRKMIRDFGNVSFLALSDNPMVCNCNAKEFIALAFRNEMYLNQNSFIPRKESNHRRLSDFNYHSGFVDVNDQILTRRNLSRFIHLDRLMEITAEGNFVLIDYRRDAYTCLYLPESITIPFEEVTSCHARTQLDEQLQVGTRYLFALVIPCVLLPLLVFGYTYRRNLKYFCVMMRNSAMLSMVNENKTYNDDTIYNYDVFVSYCNEDRPWVLDQLLSHLEKDCSVSLCLHERDFQVGLTILENIMSCMDRSKSIMLVISKQFLRSQWCQFEMHLAQHRLLETRREDLILILLEDIPRSIRPNTLHYLMLTKTYILWPKNKSEQQVFWKRLKRSITTQKQREDRVSLA